jgi:hypothetical protein
MTPPRWDHRGEPLEQLTRGKLGSAMGRDGLLGDPCAIQVVFG